MITYEYLKKNNLILFEAITGSQAYGTNTATSDEDKKFVFILPEKNILGFGYVDYVEVNKDHNGWEIKRFLELLEVNNPTALEFLNSPEECIVYKNPIFDLLLNQKDKLITKMCKNSFGGYARQQISKAKGLNKKQNWVKSKVTRKDLIDFVYVIDGDKTISFKKWNNGRYYEKFIGTVNLPNAKDTYALFYDKTAAMIHSDMYDENTRAEMKKVLKEAGKPMGFGYKGLVKVGEEDLNGKTNYGVSNQLRLSSIPKGETPICTVVFNKDGYSEHCKDYKEYQEWLENRNVTRYVEVKNHGQQIDGKNLLHCIRLIDMATEIGQGKGINVKRHNAEFLLSIRRGEMDLQTLLDKANGDLELMDEIYNNSNLPNSVPKELLDGILINIRKNIYNTTKINVKKYIKDLINNLQSKRADLAHVKLTKVIDHDKISELSKIIDQANKFLKK